MNMKGKYKELLLSLSLLGVFAYIGILASGMGLDKADVPVIEDSFPDRNNGRTLADYHGSFSFRDDNNHPINLLTPAGRVVYYQRMHGIDQQLDGRYEFAHGAETVDEWAKGCVLIRKSGNQPADLINDVTCQVSAEEVAKIDEIERTEREWLLSRPGDHSCFFIFCWKSKGKELAEEQAASEVERQKPLSK